MSNKTNIGCGISAAAILAILSGNAFGAITTPDYSTGFDGSGTTHAASTVLGGTVFNFNGSGTDWTGSPAYVLVRGSTDNKAITLSGSGNCSPYKEGSIAGSGSFSFQTVAQMSASTAPKVVASVGDASWNGGNAGLTLVYQNGAVKLLNWKKGTGTQVLIEKTVDGAETAYHAYLVTYDQANAQVKLFVDGVQAGETASVEYAPGVAGYQLGGIYGGSGEISLDGTACIKGEGILVDDAALWKSDVSAEAAEIAAKFAVWPEAITEITLAPGEVNWSAVKPSSLGQSVAITLSGETILTLGESVDFGALVLKGTGTLLVTDPDNCTLTSLNRAADTNFGYVFDATSGLTADETIKGYVTTQPYLLIFKGDGENGVTIDLGTDFGGTLPSHLVFDGGTHALRLSRGNTPNAPFGIGASDTNPTVLVKNAATLNFGAKDLTGWAGSYDANGVIRVNDGCVLNFSSYASGNSIYYRQRLVIDPGATVNVPSDNDKFRFYGGAAGDNIFVPANGGEKVATFNGNIGLYKDGTTGFGINVGSGSKLQLNGRIIQGDSKNYSFAKRGAGTLSGVQFDGNTTIVNNISKLDGLKVLSGTTIHVGGNRTLCGTVEVARGATLDLRSNDIFGYENEATMIVKGTLLLNDKRQTVKNGYAGEPNVFILHPGAVVRGTMPREAVEADEAAGIEAQPAVTVDGGCHLNFFADTVFKMVKDEDEEGDTATIDAILGPQGQPLSIDVAKDLTLEVTAAASCSDGYRHAGFNKTGAGCLKVTGDVSTQNVFTLTEGSVLVTQAAKIPSAGITTEVPKAMVLTQSVADGTLYKLSLKMFTISVQ